MLSFNDCQDEVVGHFKSKLGVSIVAKRLTRDGNAYPEALHETKHFHGFRQVRVAIVGHAGLPEILLRNAAERSSRISELDAIIEPCDPYWRVRIFVSSVHYGIPRNLLKGNEWIGW